MREKLRIDGHRCVEVLQPQQFWSSWQPTPPVPNPEVPVATVPVTAVLGADPPPPGPGRSITSVPQPARSKRQLRREQGFAAATLELMVAAHQRNTAGCCHASPILDWLRCASPSRLSDARLHRTFARRRRRQNESRRNERPYSWRNCQSWASHTRRMRGRNGNMYSLEEPWQAPPPPDRRAGEGRH
jgi:hypothetical protein